MFQPPFRRLVLPVLLVLGAAMPVPLPSPASAAAPAAVADAGEDELRLTGLVLLSGIADLRPDGRDADGIQVDGVSFLDDPAVVDLLRPFLGRAIEPSLLEEVTRLLVAACRDRNRPVVDVAIPAGQDITNGVIQVVVTEFRLGRVVPSGNRWYGDRLLIRRLGMQEGEAIDSRRLEEGVSALNASGFRRVEAVLRPSDRPGHTDILLRTEDRLPVRGTVAFDNTGTTATGRARWTAGLQWGNALWLDHIATYRYATSSRFFIDHDRTQPGREAPLTETHMGEYEVPLPWRDRLVLSGSHSRSDPRTGNDLFRSKGVNTAATVTYSMSRTLGSGLPLTLALAYDYKRSNNNLAFGGTTISDTSWAVHQGIGRATVAVPDSLGQTALTLTGLFSPGELTGANTDERFAAGRAEAQARYAIGRVGLDRQLLLPRGALATARVQGQYASARLPSSEQMTIGGLGTVRGYAVGAAAGDHGIVASAELLSPPLPSASLLGLPDDLLRLAAFWDYAHVAARRPVEGEIARASLAGAGVGMRYALGPWISFNADMAWQLRAEPGGAKGGRTLHLSLTLSH